MFGGLAAGCSSFLLKYHQHIFKNNPNLNTSVLRLCIFTTALSEIFFVLFLIQTPVSTCFPSVFRPGPIMSIHPVHILPVIWIFWIEG